MRDADDVKWGFITFGVCALTFSVPFLGLAVLMTLLLP